MSGIEVTATRPASRGVRTEIGAGASRQSGFNDILARALLVLVALAPIPLGSNRPFFWATNAFIVGLVGLIYIAALRRAHEPLRVGFGRLWPSVVLYGVVAVYLVIQALPLAPFSGAAAATLLAVPTASGGTLAGQAISLAPTSTWLMLMRWVTYGVLFVLVVQVATRAHRRDLMLNVIIAIVAAYAIFGLASLLQLGDTLLSMPKWAYEGSATATFVNRNSFATFLSFGAVVTVTMLAGTFVRQDDVDGRRPAVDPIVLIYLLALATIFAALFATQSRMGVLSGVVGCVVVAILAQRRLRWRRGWLLLFLPVALVAAGAITYLYGQGLVERLGSQESTADVRLDLYAQVIEMIRARPLLGYGGGAFEQAFQLFHRPPVSPDLVWDRAHNTYLALWSELGVVAGSIPILLVGVAAVRLAWNSSRAGSDWAGRVAAVGVVVVAAVHSLADFSLEIQANTILFVLLLGLGTSAAASKRSLR
ncbi:MAG: O-antigen ligase domain-containing protein [Hyphomicrobiales bacterium]|nr:MAG: O-antigen ligase domain-containing protein [Hyphomicrobiales bacterium]